MKKSVLYIPVVFLIFVFPLILAQNETITLDTLDPQEKIDEAYACLEEKVEDKTCMQLSLGEKIFSLLSIRECKDELLADSEDEECWPRLNCKVKQTAQASLALNKVGVDTEKAEQWLLSRKTIPSDMGWYLEIESPEEAICEITYSGVSYEIFIGEDKKINSGAGNCLTLSEGNWWLRVAPTCYNKDIEISCDKQFLTALLYKKKTSSTIHVSEKTSSASAGGTTTEKVNSICFAQGTSCDYEGSLWAALILDYLDYDVSAYLPYLIAMEEENQKYLPESFLYILTGYSDFRNDLLFKQKSSGYWDESGDKFYDTALALYGFQYEDTQEKTNSVNWLLEVQNENGCWQESIENTAFILHSLWPKISMGISSGEVENETSIDCEDAGYYCMSQVKCEGQILFDYSCAGVSRCCDSSPPSLGICADQGGEICNSNQECIGGTIVTASDINYGEVCCVIGRCEIPVVQKISACEQYGGTCRSYGCGDDEEETGDTCAYSGDSCCIGEGTKDAEEKSYLLIWIFSVLILLTILGIVFRDKLRPFWLRIKSKFGKSRTRLGLRPRPGMRRPMARFPQASSKIPLRRPTLRRIIPSTPRQKSQPEKKPVSESSKQVEKLGPKPKRSAELDDVLKKLKEVSK